MPDPKSNKLTRRHFVGAAGAGLGLAALYYNWPRNEKETKNPALQTAPEAGPSLGIALAGLGMYAIGELAPALQQTKRSHLAGLISGTSSKRKKYGKEYQIDDQHIYTYETFDQIADDDAIDAVYVVLPNAMHAEYSIRAAEAGKHVICEKPMAVSVAECEKMIDACKANGVTLNVGYRLHHDPHHDALREAAKTLPLGPVTSIQSEFGFRMKDLSHWRLHKELSGGGPLMDVGIYCIQAARYCTDEEPIAVTAREYKTDPETYYSVEETILWEMEFPSGVVAACHSSYNYRCERLYVAYSNYHTAELSPAYYYRGIEGNLGKEVFDFGDHSQQAAHMDAISRSIYDGIPTTTGGEEGLQDMRIIEAIYKSAQNGGIRVSLA
ncbi:Gfo/Idh/MocA family oxidoreductase [Pelagicoccus sp. SDUM812003]|uniref:Gfo/Idh/MocA family protein n=1 Tax=Pelagicoccus sp. SDUM812003 TaxID=3041267 RepID=UPI00280FCE52|nr:Gfo/Idh/MocA family oxidoreductase [Pelagicoccus sp. SDUM812003]MDQ8202569.1 Gfo/Idh/MocA family oxidoreductase [Pelagicoccus sp. SDUM812003]